MKKDKTKDQEQKRTPRRLNLSRETILVLDGPELLGLAKGGVEEPDTVGTCPKNSSLVTGGG